MEGFMRNIIGVLNAFTKSPEKRLDILAENYNEANTKLHDEKNDSDKWLTLFLNETQDRQWFYDVVRLFDDYYVITETRSQMLHNETNTKLSSREITRSFRDHSSYCYDAKLNKPYFRNDKGDEIKAKDADCIGMLEKIIEFIQKYYKDKSELKRVLITAKKLKGDYYKRLSEVLPNFDKYYESTRGQNVNSKNANSLRKNEDSKLSVMARYFDHYIKSKQNYEELVGKRKGIFLVAEGYAYENDLETPNEIRSIDGEGEKVKASDFLFPAMSDLQERIMESSRYLSYRSLYDRMVGREDDDYDKAVDISRYPFLQKVGRNLLTICYQKMRNSTEESIKNACVIMDVSPADLGLDRIPKYDELLQTDPNKNLIEERGD